MNSRDTAEYDYLAIEAQAFSIKIPSLFFSLYSPPRNPKLIDSERERLHEDLRYASKMVRSIERCRIYLKVLLRRLADS